MADVNATPPLYGDPEFFAEQFADIIDLDYIDNMLTGLELALTDMIVYHVKEGKKANEFRERISEAHRMSEVREQ